MTEKDKFIDKKKDSIDNKEHTTLDSFDLLDNTATIGQAVGHVINDICASIYFFQLVFQMNKVRGLTSAQSGLVLSAGQLADSITTPLVGMFSDKFESSLGKRVPLQIFGLTFLLIFYPPIQDVQFDWPLFIHSFMPDYDLGWVRCIFQCVCAGSMNIGWASVQIAHLSLIPQLTLVEEKRTKLTGQRQSFSYVSTILVLVLAFAIFPQLEHSSLLAFRILVGIAVSLGLIASVFFLCSVQEKKLSEQSLAQKDRYKEWLRFTGNARISSLGQMSENRRSGDKMVKWQAWLKFPIFWAQGMLYVAGRVLMNVTMTLTPFFINEVLQFSVDPTKPINIQIATIPCVTYSFSMVVGAYYYKLIEQFHIKTLIFLTMVCGSITFLLLFLIGLQPEFAMCAQVVQAFVGIFSSVVLTGATAMINHVIGEQTNSSAFIIGTQSLCEKLFNGVIIVTISSYLDGGSKLYINSVNTIVPICCLVVTQFIIWFDFKFPKFDQEDFQYENNNVTPMPKITEKGPQKNEQIKV